MAQLTVKGLNPDDTILGLLEIQTEMLTSEKGFMPLNRKSIFSIVHK